MQADAGFFKVGALVYLPQNTWLVKKTDCIGEVHVRTGEPKYGLITNLPIGSEHNFGLEIMLGDEIVSVRRDAVYICI